MIVWWSPYMSPSGSIATALGVNFFEIQIVLVVLDPGGRVGGEFLPCRFGNRIGHLNPFSPKESGSFFPFNDLVFISP